MGSPAAVPWILQNCWEYYDFTRNADYLKEKIYPMMKEEATLYDQILIKDADGKLVSSPSYSPEHGPKTSGNTYEQTLVWQLYQDTIEAAGIVGETDTAKVTQWKKNQSDLKGPIEVGNSGQIKEWIYRDNRKQPRTGLQPQTSFSYAGTVPGRPDFCRYTGTAGSSKSFHGKPCR